MVHSLGGDESGAVEHCSRPNDIDSHSVRIEVRRPQVELVLSAALWGTE